LINKCRYQRSRTDKVGSKITVDLVERQKPMMPETGRDGGHWNALELAVRPEALREDYIMRLSSCISDLRPMAARSFSSQK